MSISKEIRASIRGDNKHFAPQEAFLNLSYALGVAADVAIAFWLLSVAKGDFSWLVWVAYLMLAASAMMMIVGLFWYWLWFAERGFGRWFVAAAFTLVGIGLVFVGTRFGSDTAQVCGAVFACAAPAYGAWRLAVLIALKLFRVVLVGTQQIGQVWRGVLPH